MKRLLSQGLEKICANPYYVKKLPASSAGLFILIPLAQPAQDSVRFFLIVVIVFIILLFVAVAILLPLTLRITRGRQKKGTPGPSAEQTPMAEANQTPAPQMSSVAEATETAPAAATLVEDLTATEPGLRAIKVEQEPETLPISGQRPANIGWKIAGLTDTGLRRELNEDNLLMLEDDMPCGLYVVADGMGGHDAGEIASRLTINSIQEHFNTHTPTSVTTSLDDWLKSAAMAANQVVLANQGERVEEKKMGSTLVMALVTNGQAHIANVGDSRAYHLNNNTIRQISVDHSLVERLIQIGQLTREEARTHKQKNVIYNTVGDKLEMEVGLYHVALQPGDRLLLCSDGLSGMITDGEILQISRGQPNPAEACKALIQAAKRAGGYDNITAIIVQMNA